MKHYCLFIIVLASFCWERAQAQILNDSTRNVYGTKTTRTFKENDYLRGNYTTRPVDTTLNNMYQYRNWFQDTTFYQDLGNVGTASKPILWHLPTRIGARLGKEVFNRYAYDPYNFTYFDTKSPYSQLFYVQGGQGEQVFEAKHSRSFKNIASIGFTFAKLSGDKQIGVTQGSGRQNGQVTFSSISLFGHLQNKSGKYHLFTNYTRSNQKVIESGGLKLSPGYTEDTLFKQGPAARIWLYNAANQERRNQFHITQFYNIAKEYIKVYHTTDYRRQRNKFLDERLQLTTNAAGQRVVPVFYPEFRIDSVATNDSTSYHELENTFGITGNHPLFVYRAYIKRRDGRVNLTSWGQEDQATLTRIEESAGSRFGQNFIGGETQFKLKDIFNITAVGEYQLFKDYLLTVSARVKFLTIAQTRTSYSPTLMQQEFISNSYKWNNNFDNIIADRTSATVAGRLFRNSVQAEVARVNLQNYVFYGLDGKPVQLSGNQLSFYSLTLRHHYNMRSLHFDHFVRLNETSKAQEIRMPDWLVNSKIYFQGALFKKALFGQVGLETYVAANYLADRYDPALQQFHLQNDFRVNNPLVNNVYPVVDLFLAADIKSFNIFLKMAHVNQGVPKDGYFLTPYYPALGSSFTFGVKWMFFD